MDAASSMRCVRSSYPRQFALLSGLLAMLMFDCCGSTDQKISTSVSDFSDRPENEVAASDTLVAEQNIKIMTFNVGTTKSMLHGLDLDCFTEAHAVLNNECGYSDNLAWGPAEKALALFIKKELPDLVSFQELFNYENCNSMSDDCLDRSYKYDFVCSHADIMSSQVERILGDGYYYLYSKKYSDNAIGIKKTFAQIINPNLIDGKPYLHDPDNTGRIAYVDIKINNASNEIFRVINVHAYAGFKTSSFLSRETQFQTLFSSGVVSSSNSNVIMGDMNMDPFSLLWLLFDKSAKYWAKKLSSGLYNYLSSPNVLGPSTHFTEFSLDHVISDKIIRHSSKVIKTREIMWPRYWDHKPVICYAKLKTI